MCLWGPVWDTINIATLGTMIAIVIAVPVAFCAARNTTPSVHFVRPVALFIIVSSRSINSLIWALMLVTLLGPGVLAGVIAIGLRSIGFCAKLLYEAIEEIDANPGRGYRRHRCGAQPAAEFSASCRRSCPPSPAFLYFAGISIFANRPCSGLVGAGGIGLQLDSSISTLAWTQVSLILLVILATVIVSEWVSAKIRHAII